MCSAQIARLLSLGLKLMDYPCVSLVDLSEDGIAHMETPNTRSRRKVQDLDSSSPISDGPVVSWATDQQLRRAVLLASENVEPAPPTPTQKPRLIPFKTPQSSSLSLPTPPTKRPRRNRSLPSQLTTTPQKDRDKLDSLLDQVQARLGSQQSQKSVLGDRTNEKERERSQTSGIAKGKGQAVDESKRSARNERQTPIGRPLAATKTTATTLATPSRSSPRALAVSSTAKKLSSASEPLQSTALSTQTRRNHPPTVAHPPPPTIDPKARTEPEGDDSFDSLDGLFASGGQDVADFLASL